MDRRVRVGAVTDVALDGSFVSVASSSSPQLESVDAAPGRI